jgi:hypothetical protein
MKNPHAMALGKLGGLKGGKARAASLSPERRRQIALLAVRSRWEHDRQWKASRWEGIRDKVHDDRIYRRDLARQLSSGSSIDPGDLEHALFNLTLTVEERLYRCLAR